MNETIIEAAQDGAVDVDNAVEIVDTAEIAEAVEKPYTFRKLGSTDIFLMTKIIKAIGINEFMACLKGDSLKSILKTFIDSNAADKDADKEDAADNDSIFMMGALAGILEIANVIIGNLHKCEQEIYQLLSQTSNLSVEEITAEGNAVMFVEMVIDFIKKDEFKDFIEVVSKLFK